MRRSFSAAAIAVALGACVPPGVQAERGRPVVAPIVNMAPPIRSPGGPPLDTVDTGRTHVVAPGETGIAIGRAYGVSWSSLIAANDLHEPFLLHVGQRLVLPQIAQQPPARAVEVAQASSTLPTMEARARAFRIDIDDLLGTPRPATAPRRQPARVAVAAPVVAPILPTTMLAPGFDGRFGWPLTGAIVARFGRGGAGRFNQGIDVAGVDQPIRAAAAGNVVFVGDGLPGYGGLILLDHGGGWISAYGHATGVTVRRGDSVVRGAAMARTARDRDATLHFQLRQKRRPVDPLLYLSSRTSSLP